MKTKNKKSLLALLLLSKIVFAASCYDENIYTEIKNVAEDIQVIGYAIGALMITYQGMKWMSSNNDQEREDAKRGVIYVIIGLLLLVAGGQFLIYLICGVSAT